MNIIESHFRWNGALRDRTSTDYVIVHHAKAKSCTIADIHRWHLDRGFLGVGYNYFVSKNGLVYRGRPDDKSDADARGYNYNSISICLEGDFTQEVISMKQQQTLIDLLVDIRKKWGKLKMMRHKDVNYTECPGDIGWIKVLSEVENVERLEKEKKTQYATVEDVDKLRKEFDKMKQFLSKELNIRIR